MNPYVSQPIKSLAILALALGLATSTPAADGPSKFPNVGETYKISNSAPLAETPYDNIVTVTALGDHQWAKVQYQVSARQGGKEKREMWINFALVASAVAAQPAK
ncbi:MAG TPA: hypothetical protein VGH65_04540 [Verrucomicrobiaceae bacterium]